MLGKKCRKVWKAAPLCLFWAVWMERNRIAFDNEDFSVHRLKNSFVWNLWVWTKSIVNEGPLPLLSFFYWLGARWGSVLCFLFFCVCLKGPFVYSLYAGGFSSRCPFLFYFCICLSKKKNGIINTLSTKTTIATIAKQSHKNGFAYVTIQVKKGSLTPSNQYLK